jgi:hypothetical protein
MSDQVHSEAGHRWLESPAIEQPLTQQEPTQVSTGMGLAIAGIWFSTMGMLSIMAWLLITKLQVADHQALGVAIENPYKPYLAAGFGYFFLALLSLFFACWTTYTVRTGKY